MHRYWTGLLLIASLGCGSPSGPRSGSVVLSSIESGSTNGHQFGAAFLEADIEDVVTSRYPTCTVPASAGDCYMLDCPAQPPPFFSAGTITASVAGTELLSATPTSAGIYNVIDSGPAFTAGQVVSFAASGADVPAFTGSVTGPETPATTLPTTIPSTVDLVVSWPPSIAAEDVTLGIVSMDAVLLCRAPASQGSITVASSLLTAFGTGNIGLSVAGANSTRVTAGAYTIDLSAQARAHTTAVIE